MFRSYQYWKKELKGGAKLQLNDQQTSLFQQKVTPWLKFSGEVTPRLGRQRNVIGLQRERVLIQPEFIIWLEHVQTRTIEKFMGNSTNFEWIRNDSDNSSRGNFQRFPGKQSGWLWIRGWLVLTSGKIISLRFSLKMNPNRVKTQECTNMPCDKTFCPFVDSRCHLRVTGDIWLQLTENVSGKTCWEKRVQGVGVMFFLPTPTSTSYVLSCFPSGRKTSSFSILEPAIESGARSVRANYGRASNPINWGHPWSCRGQSRW